MELLKKLINNNMTKKQLKEEIDHLKSIVIFDEDKMRGIRDEFIMYKRSNDKVIKELKEKVDILVKELGGEFVKEDYIETKHYFNAWNWGNGVKKVISERLKFIKVKKTKK
jgi:hypothetical protein